VGLNHHTGDPIDPQMEGIFDNYSVKRQIINSGYVKTKLFLLMKKGNKKFRVFSTKKQFCSKQKQFIGKHKYMCYIKSASNLENMIHLDILKMN
jgi:hypothetical protein